MGQYRLAALVALAGGLATIWAGIQVSNADQESARSELEQIAAQRVSELQRELDGALTPLEALGAFVRAAPRLDQARFDLFAESLLIQSPSLHALAWAPLVRIDERADFERGDPLVGRPPFGVLERDSSGARVSAGPRPIYYPVLLAAPQPLNLRLLGFDILSDPELSLTVDRARQRHGVAATGLVRLLDEQSSDGLVAVLPVDLPGFPVTDADGVAMAALDLAMLAAPHNMSGGSHDDIMSVEIVDRSAGTPNTLYLEQGGRGRRYVMAERIMFADRTLDVRVFSHKRILAESLRLEITTALGALITSLLVAYTWVILGRKASVEREVALRTRELADARDRAQKDADEVAALNRTLLARNRELDELVFVTSHDLQEPARKIGFFLDLLQRTLGEEHRALYARELGGLSRASERLRALLRDLQSLSTLGRNEVTILPVEAELCADAALNEFASTIQRTGAVITSDPLPLVQANATLLHLVYQHLIQNALKFSPTGQPPEIRLTAARDGGGWILGVRDNGPGIDARNSESIFAPFKRLHTGEDNTGTGIGLALCKKAVDRWGGRIWVESNPTGGAHLRFTVPAPGHDARR